MDLKKKVYVATSYQHNGSTRYTPIIIGLPTLTGKNLATLKNIRITRAWKDDDVYIRYLQILNRGSGNDMMFDAKLRIYKVIDDIKGYMELYGPIKSNTITSTYINDSRVSLVMSKIHVKDNRLLFDGKNLTDGSTYKDILADSANIENIIISIEQS